MKTYLVTGGAGFIGSNFIIYMLEKYKNIKIINVDCLTYAGNLENLKNIKCNSNYKFTQANICNKEHIEKIFKQESIDYVVNFAAESHVDRSIHDSEIFLKTNVFGTANLLNIAKNNWKLAEDVYKDGVKFLQISTDEVYGSLGKEGFFTEKTPLNPHNLYSASKASADLFVKAYSDTHKLPINITRCSNNYGPHQFPEKLIALMINNILNHKNLPVYADGMHIRDWLYVGDHCKAIDAVINGGKLGEIYNIGGHNEKTNIEVVKILIEYIKNNIDNTVGIHLIKHVKDRKSHDKRYGINPEKIKNDLGWVPETTFEIGIENTIRWYLENKNWMKNITNGQYQKYYEKMYGNEK